VSIFKHIGKVRAARAQVVLCRTDVSTPASALLARGYRHPLTTVGSAAGAGFVLGILGVGPLRVPGLSTLLSGGFARAIAYGTELIAEMVAASNDDASDTSNDGDREDAAAAQDNFADDNRPL
jgi:hypothetical protein